MAGFALQSHSPQSSVLNVFISLSKVAGILMGQVRLLLMWGEKAQPAGLTPLTLSCLVLCIPEMREPNHIYDIGNVQYHSECPIGR